MPGEGGAVRNGLHFICCHVEPEQIVERRHRRSGFRDQGFAAERAHPFRAEAGDELGKQRMLRKPADGGHLQVGLSKIVLLVESEGDRKSTRMNSSHYCASRMPSFA